MAAICHGVFCHIMEPLAIDSGRMTVSSMRLGPFGSVKHPRQQLAASPTSPFASAIPGPSFAPATVLAAFSNLPPDNDLAFLRVPIPDPTSPGLVLPLGSPFTLGLPALNFSPSKFSLTFPWFLSSFSSTSVLPFFLDSPTSFRVRLPYRLLVARAVYSLSRSKFGISAERRGWRASRIC